MKEHVISETEYNTFREYLESITGIVLGDSKHYLISSRLSRIMDEGDFSSYTQLLDEVKKSANTGLRERVVDAMTTNETMWFRDIYPFEVLKNELLPQFANRRGMPLRIWSAACSSGQEPYSISMTISEFQAANPGAFPGGVQITATDISGAMLKYSQQGVYDNAALRRGISPERQARFFRAKGDNWEVIPEIKTRVSFKALNLQQSYTALGKFDLIFCRNVLIYFSPEFKKDILHRLADQLSPEGYLFLGSSEAPTRYTDIYKMIRTSKGVVYQKN
ncbi:MAG: protein-glutamate O-methyltransferase CheR [Gammaproteobacteria bacterium]|nr:protein-glutamate O-methyltransferase CheR [Gammaproteobacteria bacterium]